MLGTHGYMAPEQARGGPLDERADVYSLGAILVALVTKDGQTAIESGPRPLRSICARAMEADPDRRYASVDELREEIARFRAGGAVRAHRENVWERTTRLARVYRMPILIVVSYVVMRTLIAWTTGW